MTGEAAAARDIQSPPSGLADVKLRRPADRQLQGSIAEVGKATQSNVGVLAVAYALGGSETNLKPAMDLYAKLPEQDAMAAEPRAKGRIVAVRLMGSIVRCQVHCQGLELKVDARNRSSKHHSFLPWPPTACVRTAARRQ